MDSYSEVLVEDLIDSNNEESSNRSRSTWTEQALDLFISILKNVKRDKFSNQREMLQAVAVKMSELSYRFSNDQIEKKYNSLKQMYMAKKGKNSSVESELSKLFGDKASNYNDKRQDDPPRKKLKGNMTTNEGNKNLDDPIEDLDEDDTEDKKLFLWSNESTKLFLDLLEELRPQLGSKLRTKKQMWKEICRRMKENGHEFSNGQVANKWKSLVRHYRGRLELMRTGQSTKNTSVFDKLNSWPELVDTSTRYVKPTPSEINFANDQLLPYDDDGYSEEEFTQLEEACLDPNIEIFAEDIDPIISDDLKLNPKKSEGPSSSAAAQKSTEEGASSLKIIVQEIINYRKDNRKHQNEQLQLKKLELRAYRERTQQLSKIGEGLIGLLEHFKGNGTNSNV